MIPPDLVRLGFRLIERHGRYLLVSSGHGVAVGDSITEVIRNARRLAESLYTYGDCEPFDANDYPTIYQSTPSGR